MIPADEIANTLINKFKYYNCTLINPSMKLAIESHKIN